MSYHSSQKVKLLYYIEWSHSDLFQAFVSCHFDDYDLQIMKTANPALEHFMPPSADKLYGGAAFMFQQDLAPA